MRFIKMNGIGNDYIYIDCLDKNIPSDPGSLSIKMSDRHFGVGSDGLVLICPSDVADAFMRMFNRDGSEGDMCGNAIRCVGKYLYDSGAVKRDTVTVETRSGIKTLKLIITDGICTGAEVDMGRPVFDPAAIPVSSGDEHVLIEVPDGTKLHFTCVNTGVPHAVTFDMMPGDEWFYRWGGWLEHHPVFPVRANIEFARPVSKDRIEVRVWERGSGETLACGTGATAVLVCAAAEGLAGDEADVCLKGGTLHIRWNRVTGHAFMTGPAAVSFIGEWTDRL